MARKRTSIGLNCLFYRREKHSILNAFLNIGEYSLDRIFGEARIVVKNVTLGPTLRKQLNYMLYRDSCSFYYWFAQQNRFIRHNVILPLHRHKVA